MASLRKEDRPKKPWRVDWIELGRRRTKRFGTRREAQAFRSEVEGGRRRIAGDLTLNEWVPLWIEQFAPTWEPRTRSERASMLDDWVLPYLGQRRLRDLTRSEVRAWRTAAVGDGATPYRAQKALSTLSACLGAAVEDDRIAGNPCAGIKPLSWKRKEREPATLAEVEAIRAAMTSRRDRAAVSLMAYAGVRPGELLALLASDVRRRTIVIRRGGRTSGETKTGSVRTVPLIRPIADDLKGLSGTPLLGIANWNNWAGRVWRPARESVGADVAPYALRHTAASLWIAAGHTPHEVAAMLGHSTPALTYSTYGHLFGEAQLADDEDMEAAAMRARHEASKSRTA